MSRRACGAAILISVLILSFLILSFRNLGALMLCVVSFFCQPESRTWKIRSPSRPSGYPFAVVSTTQVDLGQIQTRKTISNCVTIQNIGPVRLRLDITPTWCRAPKPYFDGLDSDDGFSIAPGASGTISVFVPASGLEGSHETSFEIRTDDPTVARIPMVIKFSYKNRKGV